MFKKNLIIFSIFLTLLSGCNFLSKKNDENQIAKPKKKQRTVNVKERALESDSGIVFGGKQKDKLGGRNVMWTAALNTIEFMPITSASYDGGIIVTDWYFTNNPNESIKININFNSNIVAFSSIDVKSFKKKCKSNNKCKIESLGKEFNSKIKNKIFTEVRKLNLNTKPN